MPALLVFGVPGNTPEELLRSLRRDLIATIEESMGIKTGITRVFFPADLAGDPDTGQDDQIWGFINTGMLQGKSTEEAAMITDAIATVIKAAFGGKYGVEVFITHLDLATRALLHAD